MPRIINFKWGAGPGKQQPEAPKGKCPTCNRSNVNRRVGGKNQECPVDGTDQSAHDKS